MLLQHTKRSRTLYSVDNAGHCPWDLLRKKPRSAKVTDVLAGSRNPAHVHAVPTMKRCREVLYCDTSTLVRPASNHGVEPHVGRLSSVL